MRAESTRRRLNVGLATADRAMMVYLESIRYNPRPTLRSIVAGQQVPMELTSLGRAYLAAIPDADRDRLIAQFRRRKAATAKALIADVQKSIRAIRPTDTVRSHGSLACSPSPRRSFWTVRQFTRST